MYIFDSYQLTTKTKKNALLPLDWMQMRLTLVVEKYEVGCPNSIWQGRKMHFLAQCDWFLTKHFDLNTGQHFYRVQTFDWVPT